MQIPKYKMTCFVHIPLNRGVQSGVFMIHTTRTGIRYGGKNMGEVLAGVVSPDRPCFDNDSHWISKKGWTAHEKPLVFALLVYRKRVRK